MKIKLKNTLFAIIAVSSVALSGCASRSANKTENDSAALSENTNENDKDDKNEIPSYSASDEILNASLYDNKVQLGNDVVEFPIKVDDFIQKGMTITKKTGDYNPDYIVDPTGKLNISCKYNGVDFTVTAVNTDSYNTAPLKDCIINVIAFKTRPTTEIVLDGTSEKEVDVTDVFFPGGITFASKYSEIEEKWGKYSKQGDNAGSLDLNYLYYDESYEKDGFIYSATNRSVGINISRENSQMNSINFRFMYDIDENSEIERTIKLENGGKTNIFGLKMKLPEFLASPLLLYNKVLIDENGKKYIMEMDLRNLTYRECTAEDFRNNRGVYGNIIDENDNFIIREDENNNSDIGYRGYALTVFIKDKSASYECKISVIPLDNNETETPQDLFDKAKNIVKTAVDSIEIID